MLQHISTNTNHSVCGGAPVASHRVGILLHRHHLSQGVPVLEVLLERVCNEALQPRQGGAVPLRQGATAATAAAAWLGDFPRAGAGAEGDSQRLNGAKKCAIGRSVSEQKNCCIEMLRLGIAATHVGWQLAQSHCKPLYDIYDTVSFLHVPIHNGRALLA